MLVDEEEKERDEGSDTPSWRSREPNDTTLASRARLKDENEDELVVVPAIDAHDGAQRWNAPRGWRNRPVVSIADSLLMAGFSSPCFKIGKNRDVQVPWWSSFGVVKERIQRFECW
jgi:hypothetical protein